MKTFCVLSSLASLGGASAGTPFSHGWATVSDVMGMHGKYHELNEPPSDEAIEIAAKNYQTITTGTGCVKGVAHPTIEESIWSTAERLKKVNPDVSVGMYWRVEFALEVADCSGYSDIWNQHPEWRLKDDDGNVVDDKGKYYYDYLNPDASDFFANILINVTSPMLPGSNKPVLDYVYLDGTPSDLDSYAHDSKIGPNRSAALVKAVYAMYGHVQQVMDSRGYDQKVILNGEDTLVSRDMHVASGAVGSMFDHWSILQFVNRTTGEFNATMVEEGFELVLTTTNITTQVKGWPGPIVQQRDIYPSTMHSPSTPEEFQQIAGDRFNSELALFLLVAKELDFWIYSWFWGFDDYVGGQPDSTVPKDFFPQAQCALGEPLGQMERIPNTWTYKREFQNASVFVDLTNRTNSHVKFADCQY